MEKLIFNDAQPNMLEKIASQMTLIENSSNIKQASEDESIRDMMKDLKPDKDHFMVHLIAVGDQEHYGPNRNGDAFPKKACQDYHDTFVKNGYFFREHNNKDPKNKLGDVKASKYNEKMGRVELLIHGNKELCPDVYDSVKEGKSRAFSMSCYVPYDISSITGKKQASVNEYDEYCKHKMNQYIPEFKKYAYVINDQPKWFDISDVAKPADRIAYYLDYELDNNGNEKAASLSRPAFSAELAQKYSIRQLNEQPTGCKHAEHQKILNDFCEEEQYIKAAAENKDLVSKDEKYEFLEKAANYAWGDEQLSDQQIQKLRKLNPGTLFNLLSKEAAFLPFETFCSYINETDIEKTKNDPVVKYAKCCMLPDIFTELTKMPVSDVEDLFIPSGDFSACSDPAHDDEINKIMQEAKEKFSIEAQPTKKRVLTITIVNGDEKNKDDTGKKDEKQKEKKAAAENLNEEQKQQAENLAKAYGYYKIAAANKINEINEKNFIDVSKKMLIIKQHTT